MRSSTLRRNEYPRSSSTGKGGEGCNTTSDRTCSPRWPVHLRRPALYTVPAYRTGAQAANGTDRSFRLPRFLIHQETVLPDQNVQQHQRLRGFSPTNGRLRVSSTSRSSPNSYARTHFVAWLVRSLVTSTSQNETSALILTASRTSPAVVRRASSK